MKKTLRRLAVGLLMTGLCCSAVLCTACGSGNSQSADKSGSPGRSIYVPEVPESRVSEDEPGETLTINLGETLNYKDKLDITLDQIIELDDVDKMKYRVVIAEVTIANKTTEKIDCSTLTHFSAIIDGEEVDDAVYDVQASVPARKYYTKINSPLKSFNQEIKGGETVKGYVELLAPSSWSDMQITYMPYKFYNNDVVLLNLDEAKFTHYSEPL